MSDDEAEHGETTVTVYAVRNRQGLWLERLPAWGSRAFGWTSVWGKAKCYKGIAQARAMATRAAHLGIAAEVVSISGKPVVLGTHWARAKENGP